MSRFYGNVGPAVDGGMQRRAEAAEDIDAQRGASEVLRAEAAVNSSFGVASKGGAAMLLRTEPPVRSLLSLAALAAAVLRVV